MRLASGYACTVPGKVARADESKHVVKTLVPTSCIVAGWLMKNLIRLSLAVHSLNPLFRRKVEVPRSDGIWSHIC